MTEIIYYVLLIVFSLTVISNMIQIFSPNHNAYKIIAQRKPITSDNWVRFFGVGGLLFGIYVLVWVCSVLF